MRAVLTIAVVLSSVTSRATAASFPSVVVLEGEVSVTANPLTGEWGYPFRIEIRRANQSLSLESGIVGARSREEAISRLRHTTGWKAAYLFVRTECGGGNAWRCMREHVFSLRGGRLLSLGHIAVYSGGGGVGTSFAAGRFADVYDRLELNGLTSHALAPFIRLIRRDRAGRLITSSSETWEANRTEFSQNLGALRSLMPGRRRDLAIDEAVRSKILFNAALAKYCGRPQDAAIMARLAHALLDTEDLGRLEAALRRVVPGEAP